jgi:hypothetical protein
MESLTVISPSLLALSDEEAEEELVDEGLSSA